jgi:hypothetical protein
MRSGCEEGSMDACWEMHLAAPDGSDDAAEEAFADFESTWGGQYPGNRLSSYSRRAQANLLEPTPQGWTPVSRFRRRSTPEERERFGSRWIVV